MRLSNLLVAVCMVLTSAASAKPGAPVSVQAAPLTMQPNSQVQTFIELTPGQTVDSISVELLTPDGLQAVEGGLEEGPAAAAGQAVQVPVTVIAAEAVRGYINLLVTTRVGGATQQRALSVPVIVGDPGLKPHQPGDAKIVLGDENIVVLPAQETIR